MFGVTYGRDHDFRRVVVALHQVDRLLYQRERVMALVVETSYQWAHVRSARRCCHVSLIQRINEMDVNLEAILVETVRRL